MQAREIGNALAIALISILLMLGALSISLVEHIPQVTPTVSPLPSLVPVTSTFTPQPAAATPLILDTLTPTATSTSTVTATPPASCPVPAGWGQVVVQQSDTLENIAARYRASASELMISNCLVSSTLVTGSVLYVPPVPTNTTPACVAGAAGWVKNYAVRSGDTFYSIAASYGVSAAALKNANCRASDLIYAGEILWVPNRPTLTPLYPTLRPVSTPIPANTVAPQPTDPLTETALPYTSTPIPSPTSVPPTQPPTLTPSPTVFP